MPERNVKQAWVIPSSTPLPNPVGTAPGWWVERDGKVIVAMPGVPHEMMRMWENEVAPRLRQTTGAALFTRILRVAGLGESTVEERLRRPDPQREPDARHLRQARRGGRARDGEGGDRGGGAPPGGRDGRAGPRALGTHVFGMDAETPQSVALQLLIERGLTLGTMESCTGGLLASLITDVPGSSNAFRGGLVSYATELKEQWGVPADIVAAHGVISVETARAMAVAARARLGTDVGIGITGVAGPDTQEDQPVGTVHIAVASAERTSDTSQRFRGARTEIKWRAANTALNLLRLHLLRQTQAV